ncbi:YdcF family protein [uncultured Sphingomonas sp.]|uniref:YdcF family protein n=1 Tax=uncultured Sphingomonas sp. TaxID=158754 RepID=UPI0025DEBD19|nr:YdcF family protein [uncultured Sphingomonas sp.]
MVTGRSWPRLALVAACAWSPLAVAQAADGAAAQAPVARDRVADALSRRLFPLLAGVAESRRLDTRPGLTRLLAARAARRDACGTDTLCEARALLWSDAEVEPLIAALVPLARASAVVPPDDGIEAGLRREVQGVNAVIQVYALGAAPAYPLIDGPGIPVDGAEAQTRRQAALALARTPRAGSLQALDPAMEFAVSVLDTNDRTDAIAFDPLSGGDNAAAMTRARWIDWKRLRYSAMIVTGVGPEVTDMPLSPLGKLHLRLAADRFAQGDVPFIIVSGGRAHPRATRFVEAEEMRHALIDRYGVPADAILVEPYARHTTTNLRNATRLLMAMDAPLDRDTLIVCNPMQSAYIESPPFAARNLKELGYEPGAVGRRLSPTTLEFRPSAKSARVDPRDPLDP